MLRKRVLGQTYPLTGDSEVSLDSRNPHCVYKHSGESEWNFLSKVISMHGDLETVPKVNVLNFPCIPVIQTNKQTHTNTHTQSKFQIMSTHIHSQIHKLFVRILARINALNQTVKQRKLLPV